MGEYDKKPEGQEDTPPPPPPPSETTPPTGPTEQTNDSSGDLSQQISSATQAPPAPSELAPPEHRTMGMLCHLIAFCGLIGVPFGNILGPLVIWLVKKDEMPLVDDQGKESLNFQIATTIVLAVLGVFSLIPFVICVTILPILAVVVAAAIYTIIGAIKANNGEFYRYPFSLRLIK